MIFMSSIGLGLRNAVPVVTFLVDKHVKVFFFLSSSFTSVMAESQRVSSHSRQSRQLAIQAPHNDEEAEFSANQPLNAVGAVRPIRVNPRLETHSMSLLCIHQLILIVFSSCWSERT